MAGRRKLEMDIFRRRRGRGRMGGFEGSFRSGRGTRWSVTFGREGRKGSRGKGGRFEAMNRNGFLFGAYLKKEGMRGLAEDFVGTGVGWRKGQFVGWSTNEDVVGGS
jgi:hypothetical protein